MRENNPEKNPKEIDFHENSFNEQNLKENVQANIKGNVQARDVVWCGLRRKALLENILVKIKIKDFMSLKKKKYFVSPKKGQNLCSCPHPTSLKHKHTQCSNNGLPFSKMTLIIKGVTFYHQMFSVKCLLEELAITIMGNGLLSYLLDDRRLIR